MLVTLVTTSKAKKMASKAKKSSFLLSPGSSFCWTPAIIIKMATESHQAMVQASRVQSRREWKQSSSLGSHHHLPEKDKSFYNFPFLEEEPIVFFIAKIIKKLLRMRAFSFFESLYEIAEDKSALMGLYYRDKSDHFQTLSQEKFWSNWGSPWIWQRKDCFAGHTSCVLKDLERSLCRHRKDQKKVAS